jgi:hypothetical protein
MVEEESTKPSSEPDRDSRQFSKGDLMRLLSKEWANKGYDSAQGNRPGVSIQDLINHSTERNTALDLPLVDLWIALLDECISWLISLSAVIHSEPDREVRLTNFEKSVMMILSRIISDSTAIRHLVLAGFDTSARTILRSVSEYMEVLVAIIHQPNFADEFCTSDPPESAQIFWEKHPRGGKIRRRITAAWADFLNKETDRGAAEWFANWGRTSNPILSALSHPSFSGGLFSAIPLKSHYTNEKWLGFWGDKAECSVETIYIYLQFVFPLLLLSPDFPFGGFRAYKEADELHYHVRFGRDILASVILSLGREDNAPFIFPDIDMSIWPTSPEENSDL